MSHNLSNHPFICFSPKHNSTVDAIIQLSDGTILSGSKDKTIKRWTVDGHLLNTFLVYSHCLQCFMEGAEEDTFISCSYDRMMWYKTTGECLCTLHTTFIVWSVLRLRNSSSFLCGMENGTIEEKRMGVTTKH